MWMRRSAIMALTTAFDTEMCIVSLNVLDVLSPDQVANSQHHK